VLKSSRAISHVNVELKTNVSEIFSVSIMKVDANPDDRDRGNFRNVGF
jgi:hypothetical protein